MQYYNSYIQNVQLYQHGFKTVLVFIILHLALEMYLLSNSGLCNCLYDLILFYFLYYIHLSMVNCCNAKLTHKNEIRMLRMIHQTKKYLKQLR